MKDKILTSILLAALGLGLMACGRLGSYASETSYTEERNTTMINKQETTDAKQLEEILATISQAAASKDIATLDAILPDNYTLIHMTGYRQSKDEWLEEVANGTMEYFVGDGNQTYEQEVKMDGDSATVSSKGTVDAKIGSNGSRRTWTISSTASFKKIDGQWIIQETDATK